uniref:Alternative protein STK24 n=1 Tax=Homo sapiens TaxID=9606 RepID=L8E7H5_HUMAN|nr:alternative protein STK24 [Homo sapiens]
MTTRAPRIPTRKQMAKPRGAVILGTGSSQSEKKIPRISRMELFSHRTWTEIR